MQVLLLARKLEMRSLIDQAVDWPLVVESGRRSSVDVALVARYLELNDFLLAVDKARISLMLLEVLSERLELLNGKRSVQREGGRLVPRGAIVTACRIVFAIVCLS